MTVWAGYDLSLSAAMAFVKSKPAVKSIKGPDSNAHSKNDQMASAEAIAKSPCPSQQITAKSNGKKKKAKGKQLRKGNIAQKTIWVCPSCKDRFDREKKCEDHIERCLFGLVKHTKPKMMYVRDRCDDMFETYEQCCANSSYKKGCGK